MNESSDQHDRYKYYVTSVNPTDLTRGTLALVLAGGEGSRLRNLTRWRAKPAVPFGGKYRIIDFTLSNCINSGIRRIGVLTQYKSHSLIRHLQRAWSFLRAELGEFVELIPAQMRLKQEWYKGTADAIYQNLDIVFRHEPTLVLILSGDHVYTMDYARMIAAHAERGADVTIGCIEVPLDEASSYGVMSVDDELRITAFDEKPAVPRAMPGKPDHALASMGIYVFSIGFLAQALIADAADENSSHDFGRDVIPRAIRNASVHAFPFVNESGDASYWRDVGTLDSYWRANIELCEIEPPLDLYRRDWPIWTYQPQSPPAKFAFDDEGRRGEAIDSLVAGGVILSGARVKRSVIFFNTHVETGSLIKDSVILPKVRVGKNCTIIRAIIDKGTVLPDNFQVGVDPEEDRRRFIVSENGITLVTPGQLNQRLFYERDDK